MGEETEATEQEHGQGELRERHSRAILADEHMFA
jgi:hypothetical protein